MKEFARIISGLELSKLLTSFSFDNTLLRVITIENV
jgi:hypothetical protein